MLVMTSEIEQCQDLMSLKRNLYFSCLSVTIKKKGGADAADMEELGYFIYMDSMEKKQKQEQEEMMRDIFGDSSEDEEDE